MREIFSELPKGLIIFPHGMAGYGHPYVIHAANLVRENICSKCVSPNILFTGAS